MLGISSEESLESGWGELRHLTSPQRNHREGTAWRFGVESKSPMSQILSTLNRRKLFLHRKKNMPIFFSRRLVRCHSPNKRICPKRQKKREKRESPVVTPFGFHKVDVIFGKKNQGPFSINPLFNGWITPKDKTKSQQFRFYLLMAFSYRLRQLHISRCPPLQQQPKP